MKNLARLLALSIAAAASPALADYPYRDGNGVVQSIKAGTVAGAILPYSTPTDVTGAPYGAANPLSMKFGTGITLPSFAAPQHFICDSGCSIISGTFGAPIGASGSAVGFKDGSGNLQPLLGDSTNGQWVSIKGTISLPVTGTFWPYALGQQLAAASVPVVLTAAQIAALTPLSSVAVTQSTSPWVVSNGGTFAVQAAQSGTWNVTNVSGTVSLPTGASTSALQGTGNTSLASIDAKTPALGQALAAASVPIVLTSAQLATLTPLTAATANQGTPNTPANAWPVVTGQYTASAPTTSGAMNLATGGSAQTLFTAAEVVHGCVITNPSTATERAWVNFVTTATAAANSASIPIEIGQSIPCPGGLTNAVSWIAATSAHLISAYKF